jgi:hypothetical protein
MKHTTPAFPVCFSRPARRLPAPLAAIACLMLVVPPPSAQAQSEPLPDPAIHYALDGRGATMINTGSLGAGYNAVTKENPTPADNLTNFAAGTDADRRTNYGDAPFGNGRAIDFSGNPQGSNTEGNARYMAGMGSGFDTFFPATASDSKGTITLWLKLKRAAPTGSSAWEQVILWNSNAITFFINQKNLRAILYDTSGGTIVNCRTTTTASGAADEWRFVAFSWDGEALQTAIYEGTENTPAERTQSTAITAANAAKNLRTTTYSYFGIQSPNEKGRSFDGRMADIRIYKTALTPGQIEQVRLLPKNGADTSYKPVVRAWVDDALYNGYSAAALPALLPAGQPAPDSVPEIAAAAARLWLAGGKTEPALADRAFALLDALRTQRAATPTGWSIGFQAKFAFLEAYKILLENNYSGINTAFDTPFKDDMKAIAAANCGPGKIGDNNAGAFDGAATAQALALWPGLDDPGGWNGAGAAYIIKQWNSWAARHDTVENALNYNKLFWPMTVFMQERAPAALAASLPAADLDHAGTRAMLARFRDQVAGSGRMPDYGDSGNSSSLPDVDCWPAVFEWAAKRTGDAAHRSAALASWNLTRKSTRARHPLNLFLLTYLWNWADETVTPAAVAAGSALLTRNTRLAPAEPDKIILAPDRAPGSPFVAAEVFSHGYHSHKEQTGAVALYEYNNNAYLHSLGYHNRASDTASMVLINRPGVNFPYRGRPQNDTWYEAVIPTADFPEITNPADPLYNGGGRHLIERPEWRFEQRDPGNTATVWISNFRLLAADGTETVLNATNNAADWNPVLDAAVDAGPVIGGTALSALRFTVRAYDTADAATFARTPAAQASPNPAVDPAAFPYVKFHWKARTADAAAYPFDDQIVYIRDRYDYDSQLSGDYAWLEAFAPATTAAAVETNPAGTARHAAFTLDGYFTPGTSLTRRLVQLDNGALVVMDTVRPGAEADGRSAGPVWQIPCATTPDSIPATATGVGAVFDARGFVNSLTRVRDDDARLLVVMEAAPGRDYGSVRPSPALWAGASPLATYARSTLQAGKSAAFATVFVPHDGAAAALAAGIRILRTGPDAVEIHLDGATDAVPTTRVALNADGTWAVDEIARPAPATVTLAGLFQTYDGTEKPATAATDPAGLPLLITYNGAAAAPVEVGDYDVIAHITDPAYFGRATGTLTLVMPYPIILEQPRSTVAPDGGAASFTVGVTGAEPMQFQWAKSTDAGGTYAPVAGGTAATLALPAVTLADVGALYRVTITNQHSPPDAVSESARLEVTAAPFPAPVPDGAATGVTGGGDAAPVLVADETALRAALAAPGPAVIVVRGTIAAAAPIPLSSNKTLQGFAAPAAPAAITSAAPAAPAAAAAAAAPGTLPSGKILQGLDGTAVITGGLVVPDGAENIILRGLTLTAGAGAGAALAINDARDIFIEHCAFADSAAGLVSITGAAAGVTIAWSEFYYSDDYITVTAATAGGPRVAITIAGAGDGGGAGDFADGATAAVTLHDNHLGPGCLAGLPAVSGARVHFYNNLITADDADATGDGAAATSVTTAGAGAELFAENNRYVVAGGAAAFEKTDDTAAIHARGNVITAASNAAAGADAAGDDRVFTPDYAYALVPADALDESSRMAAAGNTAGAASRHADAPAGALTVTGPAHDAVPLEAAFALTATPENCAPAAWQWRLDNFDIAAADAATHTVADAAPAHSGFYTVEAVLPDGGSLVSRPWFVAVGIPLILAQPASITVPSARAAGFSVGVRGNGLAYQWFKNGELYTGTGGTAATLNFTAAKLTDAGAYHVEVSNEIGTVTSATATLTVETLTLPSAGAGGGGGGGGAPTPWLAALLAALLLARSARRR